VHRRVTPTEHQFMYPVSQVWIDPDRPEDLCSLHPAWSAKHPALARFRRADYGTSPTGSLGDQARREMSEVLGRDVAGPVRMLSQIRRWGWLFNPITVFFVWDSADADPVGAILEVTNTPWKERFRYAIELTREADGLLTAVFPKALHVSPFLGMDYQYRFRAAAGDDRVAVDIDVLDPHEGLVVHTALRTERTPATRPVLTASLRSVPFPTHRVTAGIHAQAARLFAKRVPFVPHPHQTASTPPLEPSR